jgi:hypothetical protein
MPQISQLTTISTATEQTYFVVSDSRLTKRYSFSQLRQQLINDISVGPQGPTGPVGPYGGPSGPSGVTGPSGGPSGPSGPAGPGVTVVTVPRSSTSAGNTGEIAYDSTYVYICVATNTWRRFNASAF